MISNTALGLLIALLSSSPYIVSSYVTSGLPGPKQREQILADLIKRDIRDIETVTKVIQSFYATR